MMKSVLKHTMVFVIFIFFYPAVLAVANSVLVYPRPYIPSWYYQEVPNSGVLMTDAPLYIQSWHFIEPTLRAKIETASFQANLIGLKVKYHSGWRPKTYSASLRMGKDGVVYPSSINSPHSRDYFSEAGDLTVTIESLQDAEQWRDILAMQNLYHPMPQKDWVHIIMLKGPINFESQAYKLFHGKLESDAFKSIQSKLAPVKKIIEEINKSNIKANLRFSDMLREEIYSDMETYRIKGSNEKINYWMLQNKFDTGNTDLSLEYEEKNEDWGEDTDLFEDLLEEYEDDMGADFYDNLCE